MTYVSPNSGVLPFNSEGQCHAPGMVFSHLDQPHTPSLNAGPALVSYQRPHPLLKMNYLAF